VKHRAGAALVGVAVAAAVLVTLGASSDGDGAYRIRAIFDSAANVIPGEDVKVAGVPVGAVEDVAVTADNRAAVTLRIDDPGFRSFRADARCTIRPQSLLGEKFVECVPTQPGSSAGPLRGGVLPVERTSSPVDPDLVTNVLRLPERERLRIILNELGTGAAGRGSELGEVIRRANPALRETDRVLAILADQNRSLARLVEDGERVLRPLARDRRHVAGAVEQLARSATGAAERRAELEGVLRRFPALLRELTPTMRRLEGLADSGTPVLEDLTAAGPGVNRATTALTPLAREARPWVRSFADVTRDGRTAIRRSRPAVDALAELGRSGRPLLRGLAGFLESFRDTGGLERLLDLVYVGAGAMNGFDEAGHFIRSALVLNVCVSYAVQPGGGSCVANFQEDATAAVADRSGGGSSGPGQSPAARLSPDAHSSPIFDSSVEPLVDYLLAP
jgi:ABC-type transporter Mla subunit MlaD